MTLNGREVWGHRLMVNTANSGGQGATVPFRRSRADTWLALHGLFEDKLDALVFHHSAIFADLDRRSRRLRSFDILMPTVRQGQVETRRQVGRKAASDPQKNQWGGKAERDVWRASATIATAKNSDDWFRVALRLEAIRPSTALTGIVRFYLHDNFVDPIKTVKTGKKGVAALNFWAYGALTVGAEILATGTVLELDLAQVPDAPELFRNL